MLCRYSRSVSICTLTLIVLGTQAVAGPQIRSIQKSPVLKQRLQETGDRLRKDAQFLKAVTALDRTVLRTAIEAKLRILKVKKPSKADLERFKTSVIELARELDRSGFTAAVVRLAPEIGKGFRFSDSEFLALEANIMRKHGLWEGSAAMEDLRALAGIADQKMRRLERSKTADLPENPQFEEKVSGDPCLDQGGLGRCLVGGGGADSLISNVAEIIDGAEDEDWSRVTMGALSVLLDILFFLF